MADVIESALSEPNKIIDRQGAEQILDTMLSSMVNKHGEKIVASLAVLAQPHAPDVDRKDVCEAATTLYGAALLLHKGERELLLRYLFAAVNEP